MKGRGMAGAGGQGQRDFCSAGAEDLEMLVLCARTVLWRLSHDNEVSWCWSFKERTFE